MYTMKHATAQLQVKMESFLYRWAPNANIVNYYCLYYESTRFYICKTFPEPRKTSFMCVSSQCKVCGRSRTVRAGPGRKNTDAHTTWKRTRKCGASLGLCWMPAAVICCNSILPIGEKKKALKVE